MLWLRGSGCFSQHRDSTNTTTPFPWLAAGSEFPPPVFCWASSKL
uniref:Uncharacterized protein n=1 Tax=Mus musculus TaxID=10090 RepID=Q3V4C3_MOUSE|nr:unnamed protein product [Mus musculus]